MLIMPGDYVEAYIDKTQDKEPLVLEGLKLKKKPKIGDLCKVVFDGLEWTCEYLGKDEFRII